MKSYKHALKAFSLVVKAFLRRLILLMKTIIYGLVFNNARNNVYQYKNMVYWGYFIGVCEKTLHRAYVI